MNQKFKSKVEMIAERYADLVDKQIQTINNADPALFDSAEAMNEITEGIRMLGHITATLERLERMEHGNKIFGELGPGNVANL